MAWYYKSNICGKKDESLRRKATGPVKWQPVAENSRHCLFSSAYFAMTANAFTEDTQMALSVGMNGHVAKPIQVDKLLSTLVEITMKQ